MLRRVVPTPIAAVADDATVFFPFRRAASRWTIAHLHRSNVASPRP